MTVWIRDCSDFDSDVSMPPGFSGGTYKFTEGTTVKHISGPATLTSWRTQGLPILGAYHVVRTPGNGGNGLLGNQLDYWLSYLDSAIPWWRDVPFLLQVDAEKWPYDQVSAQTVIDFCTLLNNEVQHGWKVCYASRGQYGDSLTGIPIDLWNAHYVGTYPGDKSSDFAPYSGKVPVGLQYTNTPFDQNGFPGTVNDLLARMGGTKRMGKVFQVDGHTWRYWSPDGSERIFIADADWPQFVNWVQNHSWPAVDNISSPIVVSVEDLNTLAGPCLAGPDPATTGNLNDIRTVFSSTITLAPDQIPALAGALATALGSELGPALHAELAKLGITAAITLAP